MGSDDLKKAAFSFFGGEYPQETVESTLAIFMRRFFTQAFKRNCQPDGIRVFPFELSLRGWWIPSDLGVVKL
jgi:NAD+ synthase (glutamine-hydrolysing)